MSKIINIFAKIAVIAMLFVSVTCVSVNATSDIKLPTVLKDTFVYDQGKFLNDEEEKKINHLLVELEKATTVEFAVITIPSLESLTIEEYANKMANKLGIGKADKDNGILLLISKTDSKVRLEIGNGLQGILTDSISGRILDKYFVPNRENKDYDKAMSETVQAVINTLAASEEYEFSIEGIDESIVVDTTPDYVYIITFIIIIVLAIIVEFATGYWWGNGFGDGLVVLALKGLGEHYSSGSSGGRFGGGGFSGGGASR